MKKEQFLARLREHKTNQSAGETNQIANTYLIEPELLGCVAGGDSWFERATGSDGSFRSTFARSPV